MGHTRSLSLKETVNREIAAHTFGEAIKRGSLIIINSIINN